MTHYNHYPAPSDLSVGDAATRSVGSDRYPYSVDSIDGNIVVLRADKWRVVSGSMIDGSAEYSYAPDPDGITDTVRYNPRTGKYDAVYRNAETGRWNKYGPARVFFGSRQKHYDPHF